MQAVVIVRLYEYMDTNTINKGKINEIIIKKDVIPCYERMWSM